MMKWVGKVAGMGEMRHVYDILIEKPEEKRPLGRPRSKWEENVKIYIK
jgi:hypothetical protein